MARHISYELRDGVCTITLARPEALNALNQALWTDIVDAMRRLADDTSARVAILTGEGRAFCAGADLKETLWRDATSLENRRRIERNQQQLAREMIGGPVPIIAAINGYAVGGGLEIALAADIRIAAQGAELWLPETGIGRFITGGASLLLPRLVGLGQAKRLVYSGERVDADRALEIGLVDEVVPAGMLMHHARELADRIAANARLSVTLAKRVLDRVALAELETALALETEALVATYSTDDVEAGVRDFARRSDDTPTAP